MKIAFRNFLTTLKRYKTASILNIVGLTMAFMALYILISQMMYDVRFNRSIVNYERVYMTCTFGEDGGYYNSVPRLPIEQSIESCPDVEAGGLLEQYSTSGGALWVRRPDNSLNRFDEDVFKISLPVLDVFSFKSVEGDLHALERPYTLIVSESMAEKLGVKVGDYILLAEGQTSLDLRPEREYEVVGIFADFARNTLMKGKDILRNIGDEDLDLRHCLDFAYCYFVKLHNGTSVENFEQISTRITGERFIEATKMVYNGEMSLNQKIKLMPIGDIYYSDVKLEEDVEQGDKKTLRIMLSIATVILIMAFINFINFFFALIPIRLRMVNVSKVFGASTVTLRWSFLFEAIGLVVCAILLMAYIAIAFIDFPLKEYVTCSLNPFDNLSALGIILAIGVTMALAAAIYPSWYITSFSPSLAAKGSYAGSQKGHVLRTVLICVQFTASVILIITTMFFGLQYRYMVNFDLGFDTKNLITFSSPYEIANRGDVFIEELKKHPNVKDVTATNGNFFSNHGFAMNWRLNSGEDVKIYRRMVYPNFFEVMGIDILEGEYINDNERFGGYGIKKNKIVVNRRASEIFGMKIGSEPVFDEKAVIGIAENVHFHPVNQDVEPLMYMCAGQQANYNNFYVRLQSATDRQEIEDYINSIIRKLVPQADVIEVKYFEDEVATYYAKTKRTMIIVGAFALVAIVISLMGVFGIVLFETQHRRREIAIRKVFGSTTSELLWLLNSRYAKIVCACFVVAVPVAWWVTSRWLEQFASRIPIYWWMFAVAFILVMGITIGLVTLRSWHAANENPADVVKSE